MPRTSRSGGTPRGWVASLAGRRKAIELSAHRPNVVVKISGLEITGSAWTAALQRPVVREAIADGGEERARFARNDPIDSLVAAVDAIYDGF